MAYLGNNGYLVVWRDESLQAEVSTDKFGQVLEMEENADSLAFESSQGFIGRDWFGPFLFAAKRRFLINSC
jgi:hypothetical protein